MKTINTCCGAYVRKKTAAEKIPILPNPKVQGGVAVIYLGAGNASFKGEATGSMYYASDHSRYFKVFAEDEKSVLRKPYIILKP